MGPDETCLRLLQRCFSAEEWTWLQDEEQFRAALAGLKRVGQVEQVINVGLRLISAARSGTLPSGRPPPKARGADGSEPGQSS